MSAISKCGSKSETDTCYFTSVIMLSAASPVMFVKLVMFVVSVMFVITGTAVFVILTVFTAVITIVFMPV